MQKLVIPANIDAVVVTVLNRASITTIQAQAHELLYDGDSAQ